MVHKRDRKAQRADKWWASVWLRQMCMEQPMRWSPQDDTDQTKPKGE
jgi:hypothetical protein